METASFCGTKDIVDSMTLLIIKIKSGTPKRINL